MNFSEKLLTSIRKKCDQGISYSLINILNTMLKLRLLRTIKNNCSWVVPLFSYLHQVQLK